MLIFFEILVPYILCLLLMPLVVKARVQNVYQKKVDNDMDEQEMSPLKRGSRARVEQAKA